MAERAGLRAFGLDIGVALHCGERFLAFGGDVQQVVRTAVEYVILDKDVVVRPGAKLRGTAKNPVIIRRGEVV